MLIPSTQLPDSIAKRLESALSTLDMDVAKEISRICSDAHARGYSQGYHEGWEAAEAEDSDTASQPSPIDH